jgi:GxxExxY protein
VYRRALAVELEFRGLDVRQEVPFDIGYRGVPVGRYRADLVVEGLVVVEVKTGVVLDPLAVPQAVNYLNASRLPVGLVAHFGARVQIRRVVLTRIPFPDEKRVVAERGDCAPVQRGI